MEQAYQQHADDTWQEMLEKKKDEEKKKPKKEKKVLKDNVLFDSESESDSDEE